MNKELTPVIKAISDIRNLVNDVQYASKIPSIEKELNIIENEVFKLNVNCKTWKQNAEWWFDLSQKYEKAINIIIPFHAFRIIQVQEQWYIMLGDVFLKAPKMPITEEEAIFLKEVLE